MPKKKLAKKGKAPSRPLPYVQTAVFCEQILDQTEGVVSAIRIFDRLNLLSQPEPPPGTPPGAQPVVMVKILLMLKSGPVRGRRTIRIVYEAPKGQSDELHRGPAEFQGKENGVVIHGPVAIPMHGEGLYWCNIFVDDVQITRMPLRVAYAAAPPQDGSAQTQP